MKTLLKIRIIALSAAALFFIGKAKAQTAAPNAWAGSVGVEINDPQGVARLGSHFSLGGTVRLQYGLSNNFALIATSGAYHFFAITNPATGMPYDSYGVVPFQAGIKIFFVRHFYIAGEAGMAEEKTDAGGGPHRLAWSPELGFAVKHWDFAAHYDNFSTGSFHYGLAGVRLAYAFGL